VTPLVTVTLVTFNGVRWLRGCITSLRAQAGADYELLVLDNGSTDGTVECLGDLGVQVERSTRNLGFAAGHNRLIEQAQGEFVCLLNQDIELDAGFLREAVRAFADRPRVAAVQGRLLQLFAPAQRTRVIDTTGLVMHRDRRCVSRGQGQPDGPRFQTPGPVWGADGPAPVYRRAALLDARLPRTGGGWEVLDEDFGSYKEDVDLAWRLRLLGWTAWYAPDAVAWHGRSSGGTGEASALELARRYRSIAASVKVPSWRNQRLMQLKNEPIGSFLRDLPWILRRELLSLANMAVTDPRLLRAIPMLVRALPASARKRRVLQRRRPLDDGWRSLR
jgi:GT2 family glycosyltransferase